MKRSGTTKDGAGPAKDESLETSVSSTTSTTSWGQATQGNVFGYNGFLHSTILPLFLIIICPIAIIFFWQICAFYEGYSFYFLDLLRSTLKFIEDFSVDKAFSRFPSVTTRALQVIGAFCLMQAVFQKFLPGKTVKGPVTLTGFQPTYKLNGVLAYLLTLAIVVYLYYSKIWNPAVVYDIFGEILQSLSVTSLGVCVLLCVKGIYFPSSKDSGSSGNPIFDYYWGTELHPQVGEFNIKQYSNCRLGMMAWAVLLVCFALKQRDLIGHISSSMAVSVGLQLIYILKFYYWEQGYFGTLDIMYDRLGFYIFWGIMCLVPGLYTITGQYLVEHPHELSPLHSFTLVALGCLSIWANYDADIQRIAVREANGKCQVWGKPARVIRAKYQTTDGQLRESLLLVSGWWGLSRHIHYVSELSLALCWSLPALYAHLCPYYYWIFLAGLLFHRLGRDEIRCSDKYGAYWKDYCKQVPYRIIPYVF